MGTAARRKSTFSINCGSYKPIRFRVDSKHGFGFKIKSAMYTIYDKRKREVSSSSFEINDHVLSAMVGIDDIGYYRMKVVYTVGDATKITWWDIIVS